MSPPKGSCSPKQWRAYGWTLNDHDSEQVSPRSGGAKCAEPDASSERSAAECQRLPSTTDSSRAALVARRQRLRAAGYEIEQISGTGEEIDPELLKGSIEGFLGFARVPLGVAGPVRIRGAAAQGDFFVPFA